MTKSGTNPNDPTAPKPSQAELAARARLDDIGQLFTEMHSLLKDWRAKEQAGNKADGQKMLAKLGELQSAHLLMLRAEEVFHDKFGQDTPRESTDYDDMRRDIGRALDRIRATSGTDDVSGATDAS